MKDWQWFGHAGHLIVGQWCRFHLATLLPNGYYVSTVGEYWPERGVREIHAEVTDKKWLAENRHRRGDDFDAAYMKRFGYEDIGYGRKYETFVFESHSGECGCGCGLPNFDSSELDTDHANDAKAARSNHMELCAKWAKKRKKAA